MKLKNDRDEKIFIFGFVMGVLALLGALIIVVPEFLHLLHIFFL